MKVLLLCTGRDTRESVIVLDRATGEVDKKILTTVRFHFILVGSSPSTRDNSFLAGAFAEHLKQRATDFSVEAPKKNSYAIGETYAVNLEAGA